MNIGYGEDLTILELAELIKDVVGYDGELVFDKSKPDGPPRENCWTWGIWKGLAG